MPTGVSVAPCSKVGLSSSCARLPSFQSINASNMKSEIPGKGVDPEAQGLLDPEAQERRQAFLQEHETPCQSRVSASIFIASMMFIPMLIFTLAPFDSAPALDKQETRLRRDDKGYPSFLSVRPDPLHTQEQSGGAFSWLTPAEASSPGACGRSLCPTV